MANSIKNRTLRGVGTTATAVGAAVTASTETTLIGMTIANTTSCFDKIDRVPIAAPSDKEPVSPINTFAGGALNHKNPKADPITQPQNTDSSPVPGI